MTIDARPTYDLLDPALYGDLEGMHAAFGWMRQNEPVYRDDANGLWAVTRHADVLDVERRARVFPSGLGYRSFHSPGEDNMIAQDDPGHSRQRQLVARRFTPKAVARHEPLLRRMITELVDAVAAEERMEVVADLAAQLPARLTAVLLGFPEDQWSDLKSWSERLMRYDAVRSDENALLGMMSAISEFTGVLNPLLEKRRAEPADDLVSVWANADFEGSPMQDHTIVNETGLFISGGAETTRTVIARSLAAFCDHPDQWERLAADPTLVPAAVEEMLRWVTPLNNFFRTAAEDSEVGDTPVRAGDRVILLYPSANRDESVFREPFRFDIGRRPNPHIAFGFGPHVCIGAPLARLELRLLFEELARRITDLRVITPPEIEPNIFVGAVRRFELGYRVRDVARRR